MSWKAVQEMWHCLWWWYVPCILALEAIAAVLIADHVLNGDSDDV